MRRDHIPHPIHFILCHGLERGGKTYILLELPDAVAADDCGGYWMREGKTVKWFTST